MNFGFTDEQELLRAQVRKLLDESCPLEQVRKLTEANGPGYSTELWQRIAELGWVGLTIPEAHGGAGLGWVDLVVLLEETGRSLFPSPLVSTTLAAHAIRRFGSAKQQALFLPGLADGSRIGTIALLEEDGPPAPEGVRLAGRAAGKSLTLTGEKHYVFPQVQIASNGIRIANEPGYAQQIKDSGLNTVYLRWRQPGNQPVIKNP